MQRRVGFFELGDLIATLLLDTVKVPLNHGRFDAAPVYFDCLISYYPASGLTLETI